MLNFFHLHISTNPVHIVIGIIVLAIVLKLLGKIFKVILMVGIIAFVLYKLNELPIVHNVFNNITRMLNIHF